MKTSWILVILLSLSLNSFSQELDLAKMDQMSLKYYYAGQWDSLINVANKVIEAEQDYPFLHFRKGVAHYYKTEHTEARKAFKEYHKEYPLDDLANEYLFYTYYWQGDYVAANSFLAKQSDYLKQKLKYSKPRSFSEIYVEGGSKSTSKNDSIGPTLYGNIGLKLQLNHRLRLYAAYSYLNQNTAFYGSFKQNYKYYNLNCNFNKGISLDLAGNLSFLKTRLNSSTITDYGLVPTFNENYIVNYHSNTMDKQKLFGMYIGLNKQWLKTRASVSFSQINMTNSIQGMTQLSYPGALINTSVDSSSTESQSQINYSLNRWFWKGRILLDWKHYLVFNSDLNTSSFQPSIGIYPSTKFNVTGSLLWNGAKDLAEDNISIINNGVFQTTDRVKVLGNYKLNQKIDLFLMYQWEKRYHIQNELKHDANLFLGGIKLKL